METARQPKGVPTGGQFAPSAYGESDLQLVRGYDTEHSAQLVQHVTFHTSRFDTPMPWPTHLPEPEVSYDFDDGKVRTFLKVGDHEITFHEGYDGTQNDLENGFDFDYDSVDESYSSGADNKANNRLSDEDRDAIVDWGTEVHQKIDARTYSVMMDSANDPKVREALMASVLGKDEPQDLPLPERSAQKISSALAMWEDAGDPQSKVRDLLTDLRHYADKEGVDIYAAMDASHDYYRHERIA